MSTDSPEEAGRIVQAITVEVSKLTLSKGDTLVIKVNRQISRLQSERIRRQVLDHLPMRGAKCMIIDASMDLTVISHVATPEVSSQ